MSVLEAVSPTTYKKLSEAFNEVVGKDSKVTYQKKLVKFYGLLVREEEKFDQGLSLDDQVEMYLFLAELKKQKNMSDEEAMAILQNSSRWPELPEEQRRRAMTIFASMSKESTSRDKKNLTEIVKSRICSLWELSDTLSLPMGIYRQLLTYMYGEVNEWEEYDPLEAKKNTSPPLTSAKEKSSG